MTAVNESYIISAWAGALQDFHDAAGPGNVNDPLFRLACRLLELAHVAGGPYSEADAERDACGAARALGHDEGSISGTWRSAEKTTRGKAAAIPAPTYTNGRSPAGPGGFADLAAYAHSRGVPAEVYERAGWSDSELYEFEYTDRHGKAHTGHDDAERLVYTRIRRAVRFETDAGPRWRLIDEDKPSPKYWHRPGAHLDGNKAWYKLSEALALASQRGYLALVNGEAGVVAAQHAGVPALCETGGGEKLTPPQLLQLLRVAYPDGPIVVALDCDKKGQAAALKKAQQYRDAGYGDVRAVNLGLGAGGEDVADFCRLHGPQSPAALLACADLVDPAAAIPPTVTQSQATIERLRRLGYEFRLNLCGNLIEVNGEPITDQLGAVIRTKLRDEGVRGLGAVEDAYVAHAVANAYHPVRDYLSALAWDGRARIAELAACVHGDNPAVAYRDGAACPLASVYLHRWLIGAVAKALKAEQNAMLVFTGPQGLGKSHLARWLCPPALQDRHYLEASINTRDKDSYVRLMQMFIWEVGELDATTKKQDVAELKQFISEKVVTVRRSYGRYDTRGPALASLIGTVNGQEFLADDTGNRRFFVLDVQRLDWAYQQIDVDQLWAEAVARYRRGEPWRLLPEEAEVQTDHNRGFLADSIVGDYIRKHFFVTGDPDHTMTAADILDSLRAKDVRLSGTERALAMEISRAMAALGVPRARAAGGRGARVYVGITPK